MTTKKDANSYERAMSHFANRNRRYNPQNPQNMVILGYDTSARLMPDGQIRFSYYDSPMAFLDKDGTFTMHTMLDEPGTHTLVRRLTSLLRNWGTLKHHGYFCMRKRDYPNYKQTIRYSPSFGAKSLPYTPGMRFNNGMLLNPEICKDYRLSVDSKHVAEVSRELATLRKFAIGAVRLNAVSVETVNALGWHERAEMVTEFFGGKYDDLTMKTVTALYAIGIRHTYLPWSMRAHGASPDANYQVRIITNGMKQLRKHIYRTRNLYEYKEVE